MKLNLSSEPRVAKAIPDPGIRALFGMAIFLIILLGGIWFFSTSKWEPYGDGCYRYSNLDIWRHQDGTNGSALDCLEKHGSTAIAENGKAWRN